MGPDFLNILYMFRHWWYRESPFLNDEYSREMGSSHNDLIDQRHQGRVSIYRSSFHEQRFPI